MSEQDKEKLVSQEIAEVIEQETPDSQNEATASAEKAKKPGKPARKAGKGRLWIVAVILLVILLIATFAVGYWLYDQLNQRVDSLTASQQSLISQVQVSQSQYEAAQSGISENRTEWRQAYQRLEQLVINSAQRWNRDADRTENRWPLEEALTLTRLAEQRLQLDSSATVASGLLKAADTILANMDQAAVLPLRRQLAADMLALNSTDSADINGLYFTLEAMAEHIRELHWLPKPLNQPELESDTSPAESFLQGLKNIFVVSRLDVPMEAPPLQSDFEQWRQRTLLLLEQTQLALLAHNQSLFDAALAQSSEMIESMQSQISVTPYMEQLSELKTAVLNPQWPDIHASVELIEQYLAGQEETQEVTE